MPAAKIFDHGLFGRRSPRLQRGAVGGRGPGLGEPDFLALVCHELRTPLQTILGQGEQLQREASDETTRARFAAIGQHGVLMLRLVNDLLDWRAIEAGDFRLVPRPVDLGSLVEQTVASCRPAAAVKGLALRCKVSIEASGWVRMDGDRVQQVLLNLVGNAIKFTTSGHVAVTLAAGPRGTGVELRVEDTGPGIARADQAKICRPFVRLNRTIASEGTGLGLAVAARLCRRLGGSLAVDSDGHSGTTFVAHFRAPRCLPPIKGPPLVLRNDVAGCKILIADDNALVCELFASHLRHFGARCDCVADGAQALTRALDGGYSAVVLDLSMPGLDGLEVTRRLRAQRGGALRIVGASAHAGATERLRAQAAGMDAFLTKPVELAALTTALGWTGLGVRKTRETATRAALRDLFRHEVGAQRAALGEMWRQRNWEALNHQAHYLHNSACVVGDVVLGAACEGLREAALEADERRARREWRRCAAALKPWLRQRAGQGCRAERARACQGENSSASRCRNPSRAAVPVR
jgi:CheY-like chemotaxis protein